MKAQIVEILSSKVSGKFWSKSDKNRYYLSNTMNTSKCKQKAYIDLDTFKVVCFTECINQSTEWCISQNKQVVAYNEKYARFARLVAYKLSTL